MPQLSEQQREVLSRVRQLILEDFHEDFQEVYSYAITSLEVVPEQANNEIRNALNHIARALTANDPELVDENLAQAKGHIERAKRDSLKLALIHLHEQIKSDLLSIEIVEGAVPMSVKTRLKTLENAVINARKAETDGDANVTDMMGDVFAELKTFRDDIHTQFNVPSKQRTKLQRLIFRIRHSFAVFITGFVVGVVAGIAANFGTDLIHAHFSTKQGPQIVNHRTRSP